MSATEGMSKVIILYLESNGSEIMRVDGDGSVYWRKCGQLVPAEVDADLAAAFAMVVTEIPRRAAGQLIVSMTETRNGNN